jgi:hypothetical protein
MEGKNMKRCLILVGGISDHAYGLDQLCEYKTFYQKMVKKYGRQHIYEIDYQKIMDKYAFAFKSLMDPVRLVMMPKGWRAEKFVEKELQRYASMYDEVDVISHSLGSWILPKCKVILNNLYLIASPLGWFTPTARKFVQLNVWNPKVRPKNLYYIYSTKDPISSHPPKLDGKWSMKSDHLEIIDTGTSHDLRKYLTALNSRYPKIFI